MASVKTYAGETADERAARRRTALVDAAFDLIAADGSAALRIDRICAAAGLNKRYFYESFADLDALSVAVLDDLTQATIETTLAAVDEDAPLPVLVRGAVGALVHFLADDPRRARVLFGELAMSDAVARHRTAALRRIVAVATERSRELRGLAAGPAAALAGSMIVGGTRQALLDHLDGGRHRDLDALADDLSALWLAVADATAARSAPS